MTVYCRICGAEDDEPPGSLEPLECCGQPMLMPDELEWDEGGESA